MSALCPACGHLHPDNPCRCGCGLRYSLDEEMRYRPARSSKVEHPAHNRAVGSSNLPAQTIDVTHRGIVTFDSHLLAERLQLPPGTAILEAGVSWRLGGIIELVVTHPSLPICQDGCIPVHINLQVESKYRW